MWIAFIVYTIYKQCLHRGASDKSLNYLRLLSTYAEKNRTGIKNGLNLLNRDGVGYIITKAVRDARQKECFELIFEICDKVNATPRKGDFEATFNSWGDHSFSQLSQECQSYIKQMYIKYYPKQKSNK